MKTPLIDVSNLQLVRGNHLLCDALSVSLHAGEVIHLIGDNGSGKTSFFRWLASALTTGAPELGVCSSLNMPRDTLFVSHENALKSVLTVYENMYCNSHFFDGAEPAESVIDEVLARLHLSAHKHARVATLSAGQRRRVALSRLWLNTSRVWLLDEPLASLDSATIAVVEQRLDEHIKTGGAVILSSHQPLSTNTPVTTVSLHTGGVR